MDSNLKAKESILLPIFSQKMTMYIYVDHFWYFFDKKSTNTDFVIVLHHPICS